MPAPAAGIRCCPLDKTTSISDRCFAGADVEVLAKLELMNPLGSVKDRPARHIIERGIADGWIKSTTDVIESTSGNLGIALATLCRLHGLRFIAVVDPKTTRSNLDMLRTLGAQIEMVDEPDDQGGYLKTRVRRAQELARDLPDGVWVNQYANELNWQAHYEGTGAEIAAQAGGPDRRAGRCREHDRNHHGDLTAAA